MATKVERLLKKARMQIERGKQQKALGYYRDACKQAPFDPDIWVERANLAKKQGEGDEAVEAMFHAADLYARGGLAAEAAELATQVLELDPKHGGAKRFVRLLKRKAPKKPEREQAEVEAKSKQEEGKKAKPKKVKEEKVEAEAPPAPVEDDDDYDMGPVIELVAVPAEAEEPPPPAIERVAELQPEAEADADAEADAEAEAEPRPAESISEEATTTSPVKLVANGNTWTAEVPTEYEIGRATGELALTEISLVELSDDPDSGEFPLDDEAELHLVHAVAATVSSSPLLSELDSDLVKYLIEVGSLKRCVAGQSVFEQGQSGTSLYLILDGIVAVERATAGKVKRLATLRCGAFFGEMALLTDQPRSATIRAIRDVVLLEVSRGAIRKLVKRQRRVIKLLMRFFRARLVGTMMATSPLFKPLDLQERRELVTRFRLREFPTGQVVLEKDVKSDGLYLVLVGHLTAFIPTETGEVQQELGKLGPGDVFGEMSLLAGKTPSATVRTSSRAWLLRLPRDVFSELISAHPNMLEQLVEISEARKQQNIETLTSVKPV